MAFKFNATTGLLDLVNAGANTSFTTNIPEYTVDPVAPVGQSAWVLKTGGGGSVSGGGQLQGIFGLATYLISAGITSGGGSATYQFSYRTLENTTIRSTLS